MPNKRRNVTIKNKILAIVFIGSNIIGTLLLHDITMLAFSLMIGIPLFFAKENWIY